MTDSLFDKSRIEMKLGKYGVGSSMAVNDVSILPRVQDYRRRLSSRMAPLDKDDISKKMMPAAYHVSRKVDGEFTVLVYRDGEACSINPGGTVRVGLPWLAEVAELLKKKSIKEAIVAGELYVKREDRRPRVHDVVTVARQPQSEAELEQLQFAVFDLISLDNETIEGEFATTWERIHELFRDGKRIHPVEARVAADLNEVEKLFSDWVEKEGGEGLVVRSETAGMFKVKPRHTLDAVVVGFTESADDREGLMHDLLLAVRRTDGTLQILTRVGGGFSEVERREFLSDLKDIVVESEYAEINSDHVAYQMVRPEWVVEISCLDLVSQTTRGAAINRMVLDWDRDGSEMYHIIRRMPLVSVISPQFIRRREDKSAANQQDVRIEQVTAIVDVPMADRDAKQFTLPKSELLKREVYTKEAKGETMVRKFLMWKTNKEDDEGYPAYVLHYTDFSPNRKDPLARDIRVSDSEEQIQHLWNEFVEANIKKGWSVYESGEKGGTVTEAAPAAKEPARAGSEAAKKPVKKKAAAKKKAVAKKKAKAPTAKAGKPKKKAAGKMAASASELEDKAEKKAKKKKKSG